MDYREILTETVSFIPPARALEALTTEDAERTVPGAPHSIAQIVAHMTFWQELFAARCEGVAAPMPGAAALGWPDVAAGSWPVLRDRFLAGLDRALAAGKTPDRAISPAIEFPPLAHFTVGDALVHIGQHNAHHLGQIILLRQLMGLWPPPSGAYTW